MSRSLVCTAISKKHDPYTTVPAFLLRNRRNNSIIIKKTTVHARTLLNLPKRTNLASYKHDPFSSLGMVSRSSLAAAIDSSEINRKLEVDSNQKEQHHKEDETTAQADETNKNDESTEKTATFSSPSEIRVLDDVDGRDDGNTADIQTTAWKDVPGTRTSQSGRLLAMIFTCTVCETRSVKQFTEQAYRQGVVMVRCPGCQNLHVLADHLGYFNDIDDKDKGKWDLQQSMQQKGQQFKTVQSVEDVMELTMEDLIGSDAYRRLQQQRQEKPVEEGDATIAVMQSESNEPDDGLNK